MFGRIVAATIAALCFTSSAAAVSPHDIAMPDLRGFEREGSVANPDPTAGVQTRYRSRSHEELVSDVFVYDGGAFDSEEAALASYRESMRDDMREAQKVGIYELVDFIEDERRAYPARGCGRMTATWLRMRTTKRGRPALISHAHLFYAPPFTIKFRSSFPANGNRSFDDEIERFVGEFIRKVEWPGASSAPCRRSLVAP